MTSKSAQRLRAPLRAALDRVAIAAEPRYARLAKTYRLPDGSRRVYCYHVRKAGGTSLHRSFMALGGEDPVVVHRRIAASRTGRTISGRYGFVAHRGGLLEDGSYFYGWSHKPAHALHLPPATFTIALLRDPVARIRSYYGYLRSGDDTDMPFPASPAERALAAGGFAHFLDGLPRQDLLRQLYMFSPTLNVAEALERLKSCSFLLFTQSYGDGVGGLATSLALPLAARRDRATRTPVELSDDEVARLRELLEPEYELLRQLG